MTTTTAGPADTASAVLDVLQESKVAIRSELADQLLAVAMWADLHPGLGDDSILGADEHPGGDGTPTVAAFTSEPLAFVLEETPRAALALLADTLDLRHRLPRTWEQVHALLVPVKKARRIAHLTRELPREGAEWVDRQLLGKAAALGPAALDRLLRTAVARYAPETLADAETGAQASWDVQVIHPRDWVGTSILQATGDTHTITQLHALIQAAADGLPAAGDTAPIGDTAGQRRFHALATLFTPDAGSTLDEGDAAPRSELKLYVHLDLADLLDDAPDTTDTTAVGVVEGLGPVTLDTIKKWCGGTHVKVQPVLDLADAPWSPRHDPPPRMAETIRLRDERCVFPRCTTPARICDLDHITAWKPTDPPPGQEPRGTVRIKKPPGTTGTTSTAVGTTQLNLAPLCRRHHRLKTLGRWRYERLPDGSYLWHGPHGQTALVARDGIATLP